MPYRSLPQFGLIAALSLAGCSPKPPAPPPPPSVSVAPVLQRDVDNAQHTYDQVYNRASQTNLESQNRQANATVISQATTPVLPSSPKVPSVLALGLVAALALGIGTALLQEQFDKRMRTTSDAFDFLGLPVIGIMPSPNMNRRLKGQMAMIQDRVVSGRRLPAPEKGQA